MALTNDNVPPEKVTGDTILEGLERQKLRAEIEKLKAESEKLRNESQHFRWPSPKWLLFVPALLTSVAATVGVLYTAKQIVDNLRNQAEQQRQAEEQRRDDRFYKAIAQLGTSDPKQRTAAVAVISDYASPSTSYRVKILSQLVGELQTESDLDVLEASFQVLSQLGLPALETLVQKNRQQYEHFAVATGRLLGVDAAAKRIKVPGESSPDKLIPVYLFKQLPIELARITLPWQISASDVSLFQTPDQLALQPSFRSAFEQALQTRSPSKKEEAEARNEVRSVIRDLWVSTKAIVSIMRSQSGQLDGVNLCKTLLLHPYLAGVDLQGVDARFAIWMAPNLANSDLSFANLSNAEMRYADLRKANLTGTNVAQTNFGIKNKRIEEQIVTELRFLQQDITLDGTNTWEMAQCYMRGQQQLNPAKIDELKKRRQQVLASDEAIRFISKIPKSCPIS